MSKCDVSHAEEKARQCTEAPVEPDRAAVPHQLEQPCPALTLWSQSLIAPPFHPLAPVPYCPALTICPSPVPPCLSLLSLFIYCLPAPLPHPYNSTRCVRSLLPHTAPMHPPVPLILTPCHAGVFSQQVLPLGASTAAKVAHLAEAAWGGWGWWGWGVRELAVELLVGCQPEPQVNLVLYVYIFELGVICTHIHTTKSCSPYCLLTYLYPPWLIPCSAAPHTVAGTHTPSSSAVC